MYLRAVATRGHSWLECLPSLPLGQRSCWPGMAAAELAGSREVRKERGSLSWEFKENTPLNYLVCDFVNKPMVPVWHNGLLISRPGLDSREGHVLRRAHSAPGRNNPGLQYQWWHSCTPARLFTLLVTLFSCFGIFTWHTNELSYFICLCVFLFHCYHHSCWWQGWQWRFSQSCQWLQFVCWSLFTDLLHPVHHVDERGCTGGFDLPVSFHSCPLSVWGKLS